MSANSVVKIVPAGHGDAVWAMGEKFTFKLGPEETGGAFGLAEVVAQPRNGPPPHLHHREDEMFYLLDGEFAFTAGDREFTRSAGFAAYLPKGVVHTYTNAGQRAGRFLVLTAPTGFEQFIRAWSRPVTSPTEPPPAPAQEDVDKLLAAAARFGIELRPEARAVPGPARPASESTYWVMGQLVTLKLTSHDTGGQFSVAEVLSPPGNSVRNHAHVAMDELFYVLEGVAEFTFADRVERVETGGAVFVPRGTLHGFRNAGNAPFRLFDLHTPGGFENFFREAGVPAIDRTASPPPEEPLDPEQLVAFLRKHGMELPRV